MDGQQFKPITILGAGSWGTALALYLARRGQTVKIWSVVKSEIEAMVSEKANNRFLPGFNLPEQIHPISDLAEAVDGVDDIIVVVPSAGFRQTLMQLKSVIPSNARIICATKGLDNETGRLLVHVAEEVLGKDRKFAVLSGPSFAREVASGLPCSLVLASFHEKLLEDLKLRLNSPLFRIYTSHDVIGVELGGVTKNVIAIATGISDGMEMGANARSALITRGLAEIIRLGLALGGKLETFIGLSGLGDLILTCSDNQSRNRRLGLAVGKGRNVKDAEREIGQVVEGKLNAELVAKLAKKYEVHMPICEATWQILQGKMSAQEGMEKLLTRPSKSEYQVEEKKCQD